MTRWETPGHTKRQRERNRGVHCSKGSDQPYRGPPAPQSRSIAAVRVPTAGQGATVINPRQYYISENKPLTERLVERIEQRPRRIRVVLPEHSPREAVLDDVAALSAERFRVFIGDEDSAAGVPQVRRLGFGVPETFEPVAADKLCKVSVIEVHSGLDWLAALIAAVAV